MTAIAVRDLRKTYDDTEAVAGVDLTVEAGEVFCLLGPNGAGKTTTTEILEGHRLRSGGEVSVLGFDPARRDRAMRDRMGIVPQSGAVQAGLSVAEVLEMYGRPHARRRPITEVLELVELEAERDTRVEVLSGGQQRRLDLAIGLIGDPDLLFLDEPTTGFDPHARRQAWSTIRSLCDLGKTIFLTTHFMDEAQALADHVAVMRAGRIVATGTPGELGGRDARPAEISFRLPDGVGLADLPPLPGASVAADREAGVTITTPHALPATHALTGWALERGHELRGLTVAQPTLEDVYLELTSA